MGAEEIFQARLSKLEQMKKMGINPYPYKFEVKNRVKDIRSKYELEVKEFKFSTKAVVKRISNSEDGIVIRLEDENSKNLILFVPENYKSDFENVNVNDTISTGGILRRNEGILELVYDENFRSFPFKSISEVVSFFNIDPSFEIVSIAGRAVTIRDQGKAIFAHIKDAESKIQIYAKKDILGEEKFNFFKDFVDVGDILGIVGRVFRTKTGELTVEVDDFQILSKCLNDLPEKWHGLKDPETRYRQRYLDLISNPKTANIFIKRAKIISAIREFLDKNGFLEVETPTLQQVASGASAKPFVTYHNALDEQLYLRIAPELYLKKLVVGGFNRVYEIGKNFRNEGIDIYHNPEFTMLEFYVAYWDYNDLMKFTEEMLSYVCQRVNESLVAKFGDITIDFTPPYEKIKYFDYLEMKTGHTKDFFLSEKNARDLARKLEIKEEKLTHPKVIDKIFDHFFSHEVFGKPVFVIDFPRILSPLAKTHRDDPELVERFELFAGGFEISNAYTELNDPIDQKNRFYEQLKQKEAGDEEAQMMDEDFITALEYGLPPTAGEGIGIDRLVMVLSNSESIREVIFFPTLRRKEE